MLARAARYVAPRGLQFCGTQENGCAGRARQQTREDKSRVDTVLGLVFSNLHIIVLVFRLGCLPASLCPAKNIVGRLETLVTRKQIPCEDRRRSGVLQYPYNLPRLGCISAAP